MRHIRTYHKSLRRKPTGTALMVIPQYEEETEPSFRDELRSLVLMSIVIYGFFGVVAILSNLGF